MRIRFQVLWIGSIFSYLWIVNGLIKNSKIPVIVNLQRLLPGGENNGTIARPSRSRPLLFQQVLGLSPNGDFEFNVDKWRALQSSGLYINLTASTEMLDDGVALHIKGIERPSLKFAPEISVSGSLSEPKVTGGVSYRLSWSLSSLTVILDLICGS